MDVIDALVDDGITYCYGGECKSTGDEDLENIRFEEEELRFKWGGTFRWSLDGERLKGKYVNRQGRSYRVTMQRVE